MHINAIGNTENNCISFITLHGFEIFDEERLFHIILEEIFLFQCALPPLTSLDKGTQPFVVCDG